VAAGTYRPGEALPSLRELAVTLRVNPNTVQRAYEELSREGIVEARRGLGLFVAAQAPGDARPLAVEEVRAALERGIRIGLAAGLAPESIAADFRQALATAKRSIPSPVIPATPPKLRRNPKEADA
jgi:GntR family transcriptional regulator